MRLEPLHYVKALFEYINTVSTFIANLDSLDWKEHDASTINRRVTEHKHLGNGSIILCHNGGKHTAEALDELIKTLKEKGFEFVPISELTIKDNYTINAEGRQCRN